MYNLVLKLCDVYLTGFLNEMLLLFFLELVPYPVLFPHFPTQECHLAGWMKKKSSRH